MRQLLFLGVLVALLGGCKKDEEERDETCDPADNPGCTFGECISEVGCYDGVFECQDGVWVDIGHCDNPRPDDGGPDVGIDGSAPDAGPGSIPDAGPGSIPDAGPGTDATVL